MHHGRPGAGQRHGGQRVHAFGHFHDGAALLQTDVVGPRARQRRLLRDGSVDPTGAAALTERWLPVDTAGHAPPAGDGGGPHHGIADLQRRAVGVPIHPLPKLVHYAQTLMPQNERGGDGEVALLEMQVRPADAAVTARDHQSPRFGGRNVELADHQWLPKLLQYRRPAAHGGTLPPSCHREPPAPSASSDPPRSESGLVSRQTTYSGRGSPAGRAWLVTSL